jgi:hypothetical protein
MSDTFSAPDDGMTHPSCWNALPWYVNGTLDAEAASALERHVAQCAECAAELKLQRALHSQLRDGDAVLMAPQSSWTKMLARLDGEEEAFMTRRDSGSIGWRWAVAAQALIIVGLGGVVWQQSRAPEAQIRAAPRYETLTADAVGESQTAEISRMEGLVRVVFGRHTALADVNELLRDLHLRIVSGPSDADVYTLAAANGATDSPAELLARLRADARVVFAEPNRQ